MFACCVLSGRGLCCELITRPEESYRLWLVAVCDQETSWTRRPWPALGCRATGGHSPRWAAEPEIIIKITIYCLHNSKLYASSSKDEPGSDRRETFYLTLSKIMNYETR
jgi:hypothetical protein